MCIKLTDNYGYHEIVSTVPGGRSTADFALRCRRSLSNGKSGFTLDELWSLLFVASPAFGEKSVATVRSVHECKVGANVLQFLAVLGYEERYELVRKGQAFYYEPGDCMVSVTRVCRFEQKRDVDSATPIDERTWLVEATTRVPVDSVERGCRNLGRLAEQLAPVVVLEKHDRRNKRR
jgi:Med18 protein